MSMVCLELNFTVYHRHSLLNWHRIRSHQSWGKNFQSDSEKNSSIKFSYTHKDSTWKTIVTYYHKRTLYAGTQTTVYQNRQKFRILNGGKYVRQFLHQCTTFLTFAKGTTHPKTGQLKEERITSRIAFQETGIHLFRFGGRNHKNGKTMKNWCMKTRKSEG